MRLIRSVACLLVLLCSTAQAAPEIWFGPSGGTPDLLDLFKQPDRWRVARAEVSVLKLPPAQVMDQNRSGINTLTELDNTDVFRVLRAWRMKLAIEAPAVKKWSCSGEEAARRTIRYVENVRRGGGEVAYLALDEPLPAGVRDCKDSIETVASRVAQYARTVQGAVPGIGIGVIQAYPAFTPQEISQFVSALVSAGMKPAFLHLDINYPALRRRGDPRADLPAIQAMLRSQGVPFGVIIWSGYNPEPSDESYYRHTMEWARLVRSAVIPDQLIIQSWVRRSSVDCPDGKTCTGGRRWNDCGPRDPSYCGRWSVPINLPEDGVSSHTRLIREIVAMFQGR